MRTPTSLTLVSALLLVAGYSAAPGYAQAHAATTTAPATTQPDDIETTYIERPLPTLHAPQLAPTFSDSDRAWLAALILLLVMFHARPVVEWRNLDAIVLVLITVVGLWRDPTLGELPTWTYSALALACGYWMLRGLVLMGHAPAKPPTANTNYAGAMVLLAATLLLGLQAAIQMPPTQNADAIARGGAYFYETGTLPYGALPTCDRFPPLTYLTHAGGMRLVGWLWPAADALTLAGTALPLVNGLLLIALGAGLLLLASRLAGAVLGVHAVAVLVVLPAAAVSFGDPALVLPAALVVWAVACALLGGLGGLFSVLLAVVAGLAWPWAWVLLPVIMAYNIRRGWQALGAVLGGAIGAAACVAVAWQFVTPSLPRPAGVLAAVGVAPTYRAVLSDSDTLALSHVDPNDPPPTAGLLDRWLWQRLLRYEPQLTLDEIDAPVVLPNSTDASAIRFDDIAADGDARRTLNRLYGEAVADAPWPERLTTQLRTACEAIRLPTGPRRPTDDSSWAAWATSRGDAAGVYRWRSVCKHVLLGIAILLGAAVLTRRRVQSCHLIGATLALAAASLLTSWSGAAADWLWILPLALSASLVQTAPPPHDPGQHVTAAIAAASPRPKP